MGAEVLNGLLYSVTGRATAVHSQKVYAYDPGTNEWTEKADYPIAVQSIGLRAVGGKLYGIGGYNSQTSTYYNDVYEYDPEANTWTAKADMPAALEDFGTTVVGTKIYCFGGLSPSSKALYVYDTQANTWATKAEMPDYKLLGDFGVAYNGKVYAIGATNTFADYPTLHSVLTVYEYDPVEDTWATKAEMPAPAVCYKQCEVLNDRIFIVSGSTTSTSTFSPTCQIYNPATDEWTMGNPPPYSALGTGLRNIGGHLYYFGGENGGMLDSLYRLGYT